MSYRETVFSRHPLMKFAELLLVVFFVLGFTGCPSENIQTYGQVTYRIPGENHDRLFDLQLKIATPDPAQFAAPFPAIVFIHGGGWAKYDWDAFDCIESAAEKGYVAVTINYRLTKEEVVDDNGQKVSVSFPWPAQIEDAKCAVRWLRANASTYHIDQQKIGAVGHSAGGHLALMLGMLGSTEFNESGGNNGFSSDVQAVVSLAGPSDLAKGYQYVKFEKKSTSLVNCMVQLLGCAPYEDDGSANPACIATYDAASPIGHVRSDYPPIRFIHGKLDMTCPFNQSESFLNILYNENPAGICDMVVYSLSGHSDILPKYNLVTSNYRVVHPGTNDTTYHKKSFDAIMDFFDTHLKQ